MDERISMHDFKDQNEFFTTEEIEQHYSQIKFIKNNISKSQPLDVKDFKQFINQDKKVCKRVRLLCEKIIKRRNTDAAKKPNINNVCQPTKAHSLQSQ